MYPPAAMANPILELKKRVAGSTQVAVAAELGVSTQYVCDVLRGTRQPGPKILTALGLERHVTYRRVQPPTGANP